MHSLTTGTRRALTTAGLTAALVGLPLGLLAGPATADPAGPPEHAGSLVTVPANVPPGLGNGGPGNGGPGDGGPGDGGPGDGGPGDDGPGNDLPGDDDPAPRELTLSLTGPATGTGGSTGTWTVGLTNSDVGAAGSVRLALQLPEGVSVASVQAADGWSCVLADFSCTSEEPLLPGASAADVVVALAYAPDVEGSYELAALAYQGEGGGQGLRIHRAAATVVLTPLVRPEPPAPKPVAPQPAAPQPVAPQPAAEQPAAPQPVAEQPTTSQALGEQPAPRPAPAPPVAADPAPQAAAAADPVPDVLPFAEDDAAGEQADETPDRELAAPVSGEDGGGSVWLLVALGLVALLAAGGTATYVGRRSAG